MIAQLIPSMASGDLAIIPDNYVMVNEWNWKTPSHIEQLGEDLQYIVAVREEDREKDFAIAIKEAVASKKFQEAIDEHFQGFGK